MVGSFDDLLVQYLTFLGNSYVDLKNEEEAASRAMQVLFLCFTVLGPLFITRSFVPCGPCLLSSPTISLQSYIEYRERGYKDLQKPETPPYHFKHLLQFVTSIYEVPLFYLPLGLSSSFAFFFFFSP